MIWSTAATHCLANAVSTTSELVKPKVNEASVLPYRFTGRAQKGNDVVIDLSFDLTHPLQVADEFIKLGIASSGIRPRRFQAGTDRLFYDEPFIELPPIAPNGAHFGTGVALDTRRSHLALLLQTPPSFALR